MVSRGEAETGVDLPPVDTSLKLKSGLNGAACTQISDVGHLDLLREDFLTSVFPPLTLAAMEVRLTEDQQAFVREAIQAGRLHDEEDAVREAMILWEERERARAEILAAVDQAEASLARGEGRAITQQSMRKLAEEVKESGRARFTSGQANPR